MRPLLSPGILHGALFGVGAALLSACGAANASPQPQTAAEAKRSETLDVGKPAEPDKPQKQAELQSLRNQLASADAEASSVERRRRRAHESTRRSSRAPDPTPTGWAAQLERPERDGKARATLTLYGDDNPAAKGPLRPSVAESGTTRVPEKNLLAVTGDGAETLSPSPPTAEAHYRSGLELIQEQKFERALGVFREFAATYPDHAYADNAVFWTGEIHYLRRHPQKALRAYERLLKLHPGGNKIPDALYKMGRIHGERGDHDKARTYFRQLQKRFPHSAAARLASQEGKS